jgi:hypothetical protein
MKIRTIVQALGKLSRRWLDPEFSYRKKAVLRLVSESGFSRAMAQALLDDLFKELTTQKLWGLLQAELGDPLVLDGFRKDLQRKCLVYAQGPERVAHIFSANVPNPSILSFVFGMLVKSVNVGRVSSRDRGILDIYLQSLREANPALAKTNLLIQGRDKKSILEYVKTAGVVVVYGDDRTLQALRKHAPPKGAFCGYGTRVSFAVYFKEAMRRNNLKSLVGKTARDIWMTQGRGCLSPATVYVQKGGEVPAVIFSKALHQTLGKPVDVKIFGDLEELFLKWKDLRQSLQAAALECAPGQRRKIASALADLGFNRICHAGQMQKPSLLWHHDGRANLASWVRWTDLEP